MPKNESEAPKRPLKMEKSIYIDRKAGRDSEVFEAAYLNEVSRKDFIDAQLRISADSL